MFLLLGPTNYQSCPAGVIRIGSVVLSIIPNNEWRTLNIFLKTGNAQPLKRIPKRGSKNQDYWIIRWQHGRAFSWRC